MVSLICRVTGLSSSFVWKKISILVAYIPVVALTLNVCAKGSPRLGGGGAGGGGTGLNVVLLMISKLISDSIGSSLVSVSVSLEIEAFLRESVTSSVVFA